MTIYNIEFIEPDELAKNIDSNKNVVALFVGNNEISDIVISRYKHVLQFLELKRNACFVVDAIIQPTIPDDRIVVIKVPQLRIFKNGRLRKQFTGLADITDYFSMKVNK